MSGNIIQLNEQFIHNELKTIVKNSVEETLNALLDAEAANLYKLNATHVSKQEKVIAPVITKNHSLLKLVTLL